MLFKFFFHFLVDRYNLEQPRGRSCDASLWLPSVFLRKSIAALKSANVIENTTEETFAQHFLFYVNCIYVQTHLTHSILYGHGVLACYTDTRMLVRTTTHVCAIYLTRYLNTWLNVCMLVIYTKTNRSNCVIVRRSEKTHTNTATINQMYTRIHVFSAHKASGAVQNFQTGSHSVT